MTDTWEELGYGKPEKDEPKESRKKAVYHEPPEVTDKRRAKNLEAIIKLQEHADSFEISPEGWVARVKIMGRNITFWPSTGSYYLESKNKYGSDTVDLVEKVLKTVEKTAQKQSES